MATGSGQRAEVKVLDVYRLQAAFVLGELGFDNDGDYESFLFMWTTYSEVSELCVCSRPTRLCLGIFGNIDDTGDRGR